MKSLSFLSILLMASMFLFLGGCQKDEAFNVRRKIDSSVFENLEPVQEYVSLSKVLTLERFLRKNRQYFNNRSGIELDTSMISVVKFGDDHKTYSLNILGRKEGAIQNLIFVETNGVISKPNIIEFQGTRKFVEDFNNRMVGFEKFEGTITQFTLQSFLNASRDDLIDCDCYKDYIKPVLVSPSYGDTNAGESSEQIVIQLNNLGFINLGHGATAIQTAGNHAVLTNLNNSINCPPGTIPVYYLGIKFCLSGGGGYAGGGWSNNGEQETFNNNVGSRTTIEECLNLTSGFGLNIGESNKIEPFTATNDPVSNQIRSCLNNPDILQKIEELNQNEIIDVCTNQRISNNAEEIALDLCFGCGKDGVGLTPQSLEDAYYKALEGVEKIIPDVTFNSCAHLKCIYDAIAKQNNTLWCNTTANFDNIGNSDVILQVGGGKNNVDANYFTTINPKSKGVTTINNDGQVVIAFNPSLCNSDQPLLIANTILHEGIHAEIWRYMKENWPFGDWPDNVNKTTSEETFKKLFELCCNSSVLNDQHNLMLEQWIDQLAKGLWEFNGRQGVSEDYKYLAIQGIWNKDDECSKKLISLTDYNELENNFKNVTNNFNFDQCD